MSYLSKLQQFVDEHPHQAYPAKVSDWVGPHLMHFIALNSDVFKKFISDNPDFLKNLITYANKGAEYDLWQALSENEQKQLFSIIAPHIFNSDEFYNLAIQNEFINTFIQLEVEKLAKLIGKGYLEIQSWGRVECVEALNQVVFSLCDRLKNSNPEIKADAAERLKKLQNSGPMIFFPDLTTVVTQTRLICSDLFSEHAPEIFNNELVYQRALQQPLLRIRIIEELDRVREFVGESAASLTIDDRVAWIDLLNEKIAHLAQRLKSKNFNEREAAVREWSGVVASGLMTVPKSVAAAKAMHPDFLKSFLKNAGNQGPDDLWRNLEPSAQIELFQSLAFQIFNDENYYQLACANRFLRNIVSTELKKAEQFLRDLEPAPEFSTTNWAGFVELLNANDYWPQSSRKPFEFIEQSPGSITADNAYKAALHATLDTAVIVKVKDEGVMPSQNMLGSHASRDDCDKMLKQAIAGGDDALCDFIHKPFFQTLVERFDFKQLNSLVNAFGGYQHVQKLLGSSERVNRITQPELTRVARREQLQPLQAVCARYQNGLKLLDRLSKPIQYFTNHAEFFDSFDQAELANFGRIDEEYSFLNLYEQYKLHTGAEEEALVRHLQCCYHDPANNMLSSLQYLIYGSDSFFARADLTRENFKDAFDRGLALIAQNYDAYTDVIRALNTVYSYDLKRLDITLPNEISGYKAKQTSSVSFPEALAGYYYPQKFTPSDAMARKDIKRDRQHTHLILGEDNGGTTRDAYTLSPAVFLSQQRLNNTLGIEPSAVEPSAVDFSKIWPFLQHFHQDGLTGSLSVIPLQILPALGGKTTIAKAENSFLMRRAIALGDSRFRCVITSESLLAVNYFFSCEVELDKQGNIRAIDKIVTAVEKNPQTLLAKMVSDNAPDENGVKGVSNELRGYLKKNVPDLNFQLLVDLVASRVKSRKDGQTEEEYLQECKARYRDWRLSELSKNDTTKGLQVTSFVNVVRLGDERINFKLAFDPLVIEYYKAACPEQQAILKAQFSKYWNRLAIDLNNASSNVGLLDAKYFLFEQFAEKAGKNYSSRCFELIKWLRSFKDTLKAESLMSQQPAQGVAANSEDVFSGFDSYDDMERVFEQRYIAVRGLGPASEHSKEGITTLCQQFLVAASCLDDSLSLETNFQCRALKQIHSIISVDEYRHLFASKMDRITFSLNSLTFVSKNLQEERLELNQDTLLTILKVDRNARFSEWLLDPAILMPVLKEVSSGTDRANFSKNILNVLSGQYLDKTPLYDDANPEYRKIKKRLGGVINDKVKFLDRYLSRADRRELAKNSVVFAKAYQGREHVAADDIHVLLLHPFDRMTLFVGKKVKQFKAWWEKKKPSFLRDNNPATRNDAASAAAQIPAESLPPGSEAGNDAGDDQVETKVTLSAEGLKEVAKRIVESKYPEVDYSRFKRYADININDLLREVCKQLVTAYKPTVLSISGVEPLQRYLRVLNFVKARFESISEDNQSDDLGFKGVQQTILNWTVMGHFLSKALPTNNVKNSYDDEVANYLEALQSMLQLAENVEQKQEWFLNICDFLYDVFYAQSLDTHQQQEGKVIFVKQLLQAIVGCADFQPLLSSVLIRPAQQTARAQKNCQFFYDHCFEFRSEVEKVEKKELFERISKGQQDDVCVGRKESLNENFKDAESVLSMSANEKTALVEKFKNEREAQERAAAYNEMPGYQVVEEIAFGLGLSKPCNDAGSPAPEGVTEDMMRSLLSALGRDGFTSSAQLHAQVTAEPGSPTSGSRVSASPKNTPEPLRRLMEGMVPDKYTASELLDTLGVMPGGVLHPDTDHPRDDVTAARTLVLASGEES